MITITVFGHPAPQGSKVFKGLSSKGKPKLVESSKYVAPWREAVKWAAREEMSKSRQPMITGPVKVEMVFTLRKPVAAPKRKQTWPDRKPDLGKLLRAAEDALTEAGIWQDDARVVWATIGKVFPGEHPDALLSPRAVIRIEQVLAGDSRA